MIQPRSDIFIVYASDHIKDMQFVCKVINQAYEVDKISVKAACLNNDNLGDNGAQNLYERLKKVMDKSRGAIILYSPDIQFDGKMIPRPNVIFETGIIFRLLPLEKILILKYPMAEKFSDIDGLIYKSLGSLANQPQKALHVAMRKHIEKYLTANFAILEKDPLSKHDYIPSYDIDYQTQQYSREDLKDEFLRQLDELEEPEQKVIYLAERLLFTALIRSAQHELKIRIEQYINSSRNHKSLEIAFTVLQNVFDYLDIRHGQRDIANKGRVNYSILYKDLCRSWESLADWFCLSQNTSTINPLIPLLYFDYYGLTLHKYIIENNSEQDAYDEILEKISSAKEKLSIALEYAGKVDQRAKKYWQGYVSFDLARLYRAEYVISQKAGDTQAQLKTIETNCYSFFEKAIEIRRRWFRENPSLPGPMAMQLKCEYFYASISCLELSSEIPALSKLVDLTNLIIEKDNWLSKNNDSLTDLINDVVNRFNAIS